MIDTKLIKNIAYLGVIQGLSFILPLAMVPLLVARLGIEYYGKYAFILAIVQYFVIIVDYGFSLSATKMIAIKRDDLERINIIFWCVIFSKLTIFIVILIGLLGVKSLFLLEGSYLIAYFSVLGGVLFPIWLFQAKEMMSILAIFNMVGRLLAFLLLFVLMEYNASLDLALYIHSLSSILPSLLAIAYLYRKKLIGIPRVDYVILLSLIKEGGQIFISNLMSTLYTNSVLVVLGLFYTSSTVGYFSAADKIRVAVQAIISPVSQALYPRMSIAISKGESNKSELYILGGGLFLLLLFISIVISINSYELSSLLFTNNANEISKYLSYLIFIPPVVAAANMFGLQILLPLGKIKEFRNTYIISSVFGVICLYFSISYFNVEFLPVIILIIELSVLFQLFYYSLPFLRSEN